MDIGARLISAEIRVTGAESIEVELLDATTFLLVDFDVSESKQQTHSYMYK